MALKKLVDRLTKPVEEQDRENLEAFCAALGGTPLDRLETRSAVRVAGEIRSVRIVPRSGAPALEVTIQDGRGSVTAVFLGRRKILGMSPGRRLVLEGVVASEVRGWVIYNPVYTLL